jgi:hypothetical protein
MTWREPICYVMDDVARTETLVHLWKMTWRAPDEHQASSRRALLHYAVDDVASTGALCGV